MNNQILATLKSLISEKHINLENNEIDTRKLKKYLKARVQLQQDLSTNDIETILNLIVQEKENIKLLFKRENKKLSKILSGPDAHHVFSEKDKLDFELTPSFQSFIENYFSGAIKAYVKALVKCSHYKGLFNFVEILGPFTKTISTYISEQLSSQIDYAIDIVKTSYNPHWKSVTFILNPYFFRCINQMEEQLHFDDQIAALNNTIIHEKPFSHNYYYGTLFCIGHYQFFNTELQEVTAYNKRLAEEHNIYEVESENLSFKGGLNITSRKYIFHNYSHQKNTNVYAVNESTSLNTKAILSSVFIVLLLFMVITAIVFLFNNEKKQHQSNSFNPAPMAPYQPSKDTNGDYFLSLKPGTILQNQSRMRDLKKFKQFKEQWPPPQKASKMHDEGVHYTFSNQTEQNVILLAEHHYKTIPIPITAGDTASILFQPTTIQIYTGGQFGYYAITVPSLGRTLKLYGFQDFGINDIRSFQRAYKVDTKTGRYSIVSDSTLYILKTKN